MLFRSSLAVCMDATDPSCHATTSTSDDRTSEEKDSLMKAIVEHSWLAAELAVISLLVFGFCTTMRSSRTQRSYLSNRPAYSSLELTTNYRDDTDDYHDDDGQERTEPMAIVPLAFTTLLALTDKFPRVMIATLSSTISQRHLLILVVQALRQCSAPDFERVNCAMDLLFIDIILRASCSTWYCC